MNTKARFVLAISATLAVGAQAQDTANGDVTVSLDIPTTAELRLGGSATSGSASVNLLWDGNATGTTTDTVDVCIYSASQPYTLTINTDERLAYGSSEIAYDVWFDDADENQNFHVDGGVVSFDETDVTSELQRCSLAPGEVSGAIVMRVQDANIAAAPGGTYQDTITLLLSVQ